MNFANFLCFPFYIVYCSEFNTFHVLCGTFPLQQKFSKTAVKGRYIS